MGMRIAGDSSGAQVASASSVAQWQQRAQLAQMAQAQTQQQPVVSKPTDTLGNNVNTFA